MLIDCDKNMIVHLLRNWRPNRLLPQGFQLAYERPRLIAMQKGACPLCPEPLTNDGNVTHIDHVVTVKVFADKVLHGELTFDDAYRQLWEDSNLRATHRGCNYARKNLDTAPVIDLTETISVVPYELPASFAFVVVDKPIYFRNVGN